MNRLKYIDILKGFSILCIVLLHFEKGVLPIWLNTWIGNFMISAFFFTSGWIVGINQKEITVKELFFKRLKTLGKPYLYFSLLILVFDVLWMLVGDYDVRFLAREIYKTITLRGIGTLWFLPSLFFGELIFRYLLNNSNMFLNVIVLLLTLTYWHFYNIWSNSYRNISEIYQLIDAPFYTIRNVCFSWPVIGIAYILSSRLNTRLSQTKLFWIVLLGLCITGLSIYICGGFMPFSLGFFSLIITPVIGPLGLLLLAYPIKSGILCKFLSFWGVNSLILMVTHYSIILVICQKIDYAIYQQPFLGPRTLIWFMITIIIEYPIVWFFNNKARFMLGK